MKSILLFLVCGVTTLSARTWTDVKGRSLEADLVRVTGNAAIVNRNGAELTLKIETLSDDDQKFIEDWQKEKDGANPKPAAASPAAAAGAITLDGKPIEKGGKMNLIEKAFLPETVKSLAKRKDNKETTLKLAIAVPTDFDPAKPQKVFIVTTAVNNEAERAGGNIAKFGMYAKSCLDAGWVCIAIDSNNGFPSTYDTYDDAFVLLEKDWPAFKGSQFAAGGFSGGAKGCWGPIAWLVKGKYQAIGVFMGGCNADCSEEPRKKLSAPAAPYRKIRAYMSTGKADTIATPAAAEGVMKSLKSNGIRNTRNELHDGGHSFHGPHFAEALTWFTEPDSKK